MQIHLCLLWSKSGQILLAQRMSALCQKRHDPAAVPKSGTTPPPSPTAAGPSLDGSAVAPSPYAAPSGRSPASSRIKILARPSGFDPPICVAFDPCAVRTITIELSMIALLPVPYSDLVVFPDHKAAHHAIPVLG